MIEHIINGLFTGFGSAIGTYFAVKYAISHFEYIQKRIKPPKNE